MKKINFKNLGNVEVLSKSDLIKVSGGDTGSAQACGTGGRGPGDECVTRDGKKGTCGYYMGIYGCN